MRLVTFFIVALMMTGCGTVAGIGSDLNNAAIGLQKRWAETSVEQSPRYIADPYNERDHYTRTHHRKPERGWFGEERR
jgi:predicted small secreted protein